MVVERSDIEYTSQGILLKVRKTKTIQRREYVLEIPVNYIRNKDFCAASMLITHLRRTSSIKHGPLFMLLKDGQWRPLLYTELLAFIKDCVALIGMSPAEVGLHSLCRSGAAYLHSLGISLIDIMNTGDWHSLAALSYLISPLDRKTQIESVVAGALDKL